MGSLLRTAALRGYSELVRELGGDPHSLLARFGIPAGAEQPADGFVAVDAFMTVRRHVLIEADVESSVTTRIP